MRCLLADAEHSYRGGLLGWLAAGNEPFDEAPALAFSRPWYALWRDGEARGHYWICVRGVASGAVLIAQHEWVYERQDGTDFLIRPRPGGSLWRLTLGDEDSDGMVDFWLRREP
jgi:hypothetical protein